MSHEIRSPMNAVIGFSELLKADGLPAQLKDRYLDIIDTSSKQLLNILDDIIDVAKIEADELIFDEYESNLNLVFEKIYHTYLRLLDIKMKEYLTLELDIPDEDVILKIDERRLSQVITNLLNNAVKFSEAGTIRFGFKKKGTSLTFFVSDQGIGIAPEKLKEIFESFKQVSLTPTKYGGTGLGLAICRGIVSILGGEITVESVLEKGSTFSFTLEFKPSDIYLSSKKRTEKAIESKYPDWQGKSILLAEDMEDIQFFYTELLAHTGVNLTIAKNGEQAIEFFKKNPKVDAVLLDVRMPKKDGYSVLQEILQIEKEAVVIMQTAYAMASGEKEKFLALGCKGYLNKPINQKELFEELGKWL